MKGGDSLANSIKYYREKKGWTQDELGHKVNMAQSAISAYEKGDKQMMTETAMKIAAALGITLNQLLEEPKKGAKSEVRNKDKSKHG